MRSVSNKPRECTKCVVARFLQARTGMTIAVEEARFPLDDNLPIIDFRPVAMAKIDDEFVSVPLSKTIDSFIEKFDEGKFSQLMVQV